MSNTPHELAEEFPDQVEAIHDLKTKNAHFAKLVEEYHEVNRAVHRAETNVEPTDELHEGELRKQRLALKDEIARMLAEPAEG
ncbi:YdcH family protein [Actibacterium sp. MT2.3-13A]|uniref:YdcH family protein n=1 Tax=Actibacterium sp. MT2.3-13A TaxID=2828332 RepID=UPI001BA84C84|nr:YdcH family protein [Actibacterium sp. MT2.3-13A]